MIAVNGVRLDTSKKDDPFVQFYLEKTKYIKSKGDEYVFQFCKNLISPPDPMNPSDRQHQPMPFSIKALQKFVQEGMEYEVQYYESSTLNKNGTMEFSPLSIIIKSNNTFNTKKDLDKIFFLIYISTRCVILPEFPGQNLMTQDASSYFELYDKVKSLEQQEYEENLIAEVMLALSGGDKGLPIGKIRLLAANYGIVNTKDLKDVEVRQALRTRILQKTVANAYDFELIKKFLASFDLGESIELSAAIQIAKDKKIIQFVKKSPTNPTAQWRYTEGKVTICETGIAEPSQALKDYFDRYPDEAKVLMEAVKRASEE